MKVLLLVFAVNICVCQAQTQLAPADAVAGPGLSANSHEPATLPRRIVEANVPLLGYALTNKAAHLYTVVGTALKPKIGEELALPEGTGRVHLPPTQRYALLESSTEAPVAVWKFALETTPLNDVVAHPDLVTFSPRGVS